MGVSHRSAGKTRIVAIGLAMLCAGLAGQQAEAGAWTLPKGEGIAISTTERKVKPIGAFFGGTPTEDQSATQIYAEYGLLDGVTVGGSAFGKFSALDDRTELRFGAHTRVRVWQGVDGDVASVQAGFDLPAERWLGNGLGDDRPDSVPEVDVQAFYGRGWALNWANAFVSTGAGFRWRGESQPDELRLDTIGGIEPWRGIQALLGVFAAVPFGDGRSDQDPSLQLAPSLAYTFWPWLGDNDKKPDRPVRPSTIQLGILWDSLDPDGGIAVSMSIWRRF